MIGRVLIKVAQWCGAYDRELARLRRQRDQWHRRFNAEQNRGVEAYHKGRDNERRAIANNLSRAVVLEDMDGFRLVPRRQGEGTHKPHQMMDDIAEQVRQNGGRV